jgi:VanZ like protein
MSILLAAVRLVLAVLAFRGVRWAYLSFIVLALSYFPIRVGFHLDPQACQITFGADLALFSLTNYAHIVLFGAFFAMSCAQFAEHGWANRITLARAALATLAMGAAVELAQGITGNGHCRARDLIPDSAGILLGAAVITLWDRLRPRFHRTLRA